MKRGPSVAYLGGRPAKYARGTRGNPIVIVDRKPTPIRRQAKYIPVSRSAVEIKGMDTTINTSDVLATTNTNGGAFVLNLIQQGNGSWNRVGRKVRNKSIRLLIDGFFLQGPTGTTADLVGANMRMVLVWDKQPSSGAIPTFDTIFGRTVQDGTESTQYNDPLRYDNTGRFSVIRDCIEPMNPETYNTGGTTNLVQYRFHFDKYVDLKGRETVYSGQSSPMTIADISTGALYLYFRASNDATNVSEFRIASTSMTRLRYTD